MKGKVAKPLKPKDEGKAEDKGNWTGRSFQYSIKDGKLIETQISGFTFTAEQEQEIRRAFRRGFPEAKKTAFLSRMAGAMTKLASDEGEPATDPRMARDRAKKVGGLLAEAASEISEMTEAEKDVFDLAAWNWLSCSVDLPDLAAALEKAATGFQKAADGHALDPGEKVAGPNAASMFIAAQAAVAWLEAFGREPSPDPASPFTAVADAIFDAASLPRLGKDAILTAIKGPPRSRKRLGRPQKTPQTEGKTIKKKRGRK